MFSSGQLQADMMMMKTMKHGIEMLQNVKEVRFKRFLLIMSYLNAQANIGKS